MSVFIRLDRVSVTLIMIFLFGVAQAQVYKCSTPHGSAIYSDTPCNSAAEVIQARPAQDSSRDNTRPMSPQSLAGGGAPAQNKLEIERLTQRESELTKWLDEERVMLSSQSIGGIGPAKTRIRSLEEELRTVQAQKMALLGYGSSSNSDDARVRDLERRVEKAERASSSRSTVDDFTINGRNCQRVGTAVTCF